MGLRLAARWQARDYYLFGILVFAEQKNLLVHKGYPQTGAQVWRNVILVL